MYKPPVVEDVDPIEPDVGVVERSSSFSGVLEDSSSVVGSVHSSILLILLYLFFDFNGPIHLYKKCVAIRKVRFLNILLEVDPQHFIRTIQVNIPE